MYRITLGTLGLILCINLINAQEKRVSITLAYPFAVGETYLKNQDVAADLGLGIRVFQTELLSIGVSGNVGYYSDSRTLGSRKLKEKTWLIQPRAFAELHSSSLGGLRPFVGAGYSFLSDKSENFDGNPNSNAGGLNLNLGTAYNFSSRFFVHLQYDYVNVSRGNQNQRVDLFQKINLLKLGVGINL
ncbi:outer membrane protein [Pricia sp.]|uniref:outer membrane protein n=1 Tax=Pricia sp. TaxID=2268138 RepID=UPI0035947B70